MAKGVGVGADRAPMAVADVAGPAVIRAPIAVMGSLSAELRWMGVKWLVFSD